jgi:hypothetical protein
MCMEGISFLFFIISVYVALNSKGKPLKFFQEFPCIFEGVVHEAAAADSSSDGIYGVPFASLLQPDTSIHI